MTRKAGYADPIKDDRSIKAIGRDTGNALAYCPICGVGGPAHRIDEHLAADHPVPGDGEVGGAGGKKAVISVACAEILDAMSARTGWSRGQLIEVVLRRAWGSHAPDR